MRKISVGQAIKLLNEARKADPKAIENLFLTRIPCNKKLANHTSIQVGKIPKGYDLGIMGIINGIFGVSEKRKGYGYICGNWSNNQKKLLGFGRTPKT